MTASTIEPGCNMPCISPSKNGLWAYNVEATETGLTAALSGRESDSDRFQHLAFFPTWSSGEIAFFGVYPGKKVTIDALSDNSLVVTDGEGLGKATLAIFENKIVVLYNASLDRAAVEAFYSQEG